jgi:sugar phosphate isomerase/epimerase
MLPILQKEITLAGKMNCRTVVMHPYFEEDRENSQAGNIALISKLLPTLEENNVILSLENIYGFRYCDIHLSTAEDLLFYTDYFRSPFVGICLDTGHAIIRGQKPVEMMRQIGKQLTAVHLHTTVRTTDLHSIPYCIGYEEKIDWKEVAAELRAIGYQGTFNMEVRPSVKLTDKATESYYQLAYDVAKGILE